MKIHLGNHRRCRTAAIAMITFCSAAFFFGCGAAQGESNSSGESGTAVQTAGSPSAQANLSEARNTPIVRAARTVGPAVVGITSKAIARDWFNDPVEMEGAGSGVVFREDGYIVTNNHVVDGADEIIVSLADGRTFSGKIVGVDVFTDLAVVKIEAGGLPTAVFGDSDQIVVGEPAIAIGNPMGLEFQGSVTAGVISALNRTLDLSDRRVKLLQTDAAINPGNSGGALVNADGQLIGINSAKISASGIEGLGFSIPINTVRTVIDAILAEGYVARPYIGVTVMDPQSAPRYGYQLNIEKGVYVFQVSLTGPSGKAGIRRADIIVKIDGKEVNSVGDLRASVSEHRVGDEVKLEILREGKTMEISVVLEEMPRDEK